MLPDLQVNQDIFNIVSVVPYTARTTPAIYYTNYLQSHALVEQVPVRLLIFVWVHPVVRVTAKASRHVK